MKKAVYILFFGLLFLNTGTASAKTDMFYKEVNVLGGYSDRDQWVGKKGKMLKNSVGFEYFRKFSDEYGDKMTTNIQMRFSYDTLEGSDDAWAIEIHNAWLDYKMDLGKNVRIGHFDPAFGLEPLLDTHGTLMQTLTLKNIGFKKDWGIGYRSLLGEYDIQMAAQLGSGMGIRQKDDNYLLTARVGSSKNQEFQYGASVLYGQVLESQEVKTIPVAKLVSDNAIVKKRIGLDAQFRKGAYEWRNEIVYGSDNDYDVAGAWTEVNYTLPSRQNMSFQLQGQLWDNNLHTGSTQDITLGIGMAYAINSTLTMRLGYFHDIENSSQEDDRLALLQFYYFGN